MKRFRNTFYLLADMAVICVIVTAAFLFLATSLDWLASCVTGN